MRLAISKIEIFAKMMYCPPSPKWQFSRGDIEGGFQTLEIFEKKTKSKISPDLKERFRENVVAVDDGEKLLCQLVLKFFFPF